MRASISIVLLVVGISITLAESIEWNELRNPVLQYSNWSIKDDYIQPGQDGNYYVFFSAFYEDNGMIRSHVVEVVTKDFKNFSKPILNFRGQDLGWIGACSPSITVENRTCGTDKQNSSKFCVRYYMTFNSWGNNPSDPNQLYFMYSDNLNQWSKVYPIASQLTQKMQAIDIDIAVVYKSGQVEGYNLIFKNDNVGVRKPVLAYSSDIFGDFSLVNNGTMTFYLQNGEESKMIHENYDFFQDRSGSWRLLCTDYFGDPHYAYIYTMTKPGEWSHWSKGYQLSVEVQQFNTDDGANAAAIWYDSVEDFYYLSYAGNIEHVSYAGRGWNKLGLSRSKDLIKWWPAGF